MANDPLQIKRGQEVNLPTLSDGEPAFTTDTHEVYFGDGTSNYQVSMHHEYSANSILKADTANTPVDLTVGEGTVVGRSTGGNVDAIGGAAIADIISGTPTSSFSMNSQKITNLAAPSAGTDAVNKDFLGAQLDGQDTKESVRVASTANIDLTVTADPSPVDGVTLSDGDRILLKDQTTASENGIYLAVTATDPTSWTRTTDADEDSEVTGGMAVPVNEGSDNGDQRFVLVTDDPITVGTTNLDFTRYSGTGQITAGTNLSKDGNTLNVSPQGAGSSLDADLLDGVELANIDWTDVAMAETDVTASDVGLGNVTNDAQIAKDGSIDFTGSQSMAGNDLTNINAAGFDQLVATPANPAASHNKMYFKDDGNLYKLNSSGTEERVGGSSTDELVAIDTNATAGFIGAASTDGVLRTGSNMSYTDGGDFVTLDVDTSVLLEDTPTDNETGKAPTSNWAFDHNAANSGVHGAGTATLMNTDTPIDGGTF